MNNHVRLFAVVGVGIAFSLAIVGFSKLYPFRHSVAGLSDRKDIRVWARNYEECQKLKGSITMESYPPVCVTKDGTEFAKNVPPIRWPEEQQVTEEQMLEE